MNQDVVSFVLRFIREEGAGQPARWRGVIKHVQSDHTADFARFDDALALYNAFRASYSWDTADGRDLSVINRVYDGDGNVLYMQPTGVAPTVLQHRPGVPVVRSYRRLQIPADTPVAAGTQVGVLEWWAGAEKIGSQTLVVR